MFRVPRLVKNCRGVLDYCDSIAFIMGSFLHHLQRCLSNILQFVLNIESESEVGEKELQGPKYWQGFPRE